MPMTPFHFGPGLLFKGMSGRMGLAPFILVNILMDIEPVMTFLLTGDPQHRILHTYIGATTVAVLVALYSSPLLELWFRFWNAKLSPVQARWLHCEIAISRQALWIGALLGAWSHIWLDSIMHVDVDPWWPFMPSTAPSRDEGGLFALHVLCVVAGVIGGFLLAWQRLENVVPSVIRVRRWSLYAIGGTLMAYTAYGVYFGIESSQKTSRVCQRITPGMPIERIHELASQNDLYMPSHRPDREFTFLIDKKSMLRAICDVKLKDGGAVDSHFRASD